MALVQGPARRLQAAKAAVVVTEIPRNPSGKILKRVLREQFKDSVARAGMSRRARYAQRCACWYAARSNAA